jgi:tetratricopeptide (TPR) repeat protein
VAYREARKFDKALPNLDEAVRKAKIVYGLNHPSTWKMIENTTICYYWMDKLDEAAALLEELLVLRKAKLPPDHPDTLLTKMDLGFTYAEADKHAKAAPLLTEWLAIKRPQLPEDDPLLARCLAMLANCQVGLKQYPESEKSARDSLEIYLKKDPNSALRYVAESLVGASLAGQKKHQDAEPFIASSAETFANNAALFKPWEYRQAIAALGRAIEVYEALERPEDAERWRKELDKVKATKSKSGK